MDIKKIEKELAALVDLEKANTDGLGPLMSFISMSSIFWMMDSGEPPSLLANRFINGTQQPMIITPAKAKEIITGMKKSLRLSK